MTAALSSAPDVVRLGKLHCHAVTMDEALARIDAFAHDSTSPHLVVTPNIAHVHQASRHPTLRRAYDRASLATPDGWPVVLAVRLMSGRPQLGRVTGADLVPELLKRPYRVVIAGGGPGSARELARRVNESSSECVAEYEALPHDELADDDLRRASIQRVKDYNPDVVLVGIGVPKQESFALDLMDALDEGVVIPVGAAIDFASGAERRCPVWLRRLGCEWLYRLLREPRRLAGRYAVAAPYFVAVMLREAVRRVI